MSKHRALAGPLSATLVALLTGCGSTAQVVSTRTIDNGGLGGTEAPGEAGGPLGTGTTLSTGSTALNGTPAGAAGSGTAGSAGSVSSSTGPVTISGGLVLGQGVTKTTVTVGITYLTNGDAANAALGAGGITQGDTKADAQAMVDEVNAHGGIHGKKLVPVYFPINEQSTQTRQQQDDAACAFFTQDNKVAAVLGGGQSEELNTCLNNHHVPQFNAGPILSEDDVDFRLWPRYYLLGTLSQNRMMREMVNSLVRQNYFSPWDTTSGKPGVAPVKVGVLSIDIPEWQRPVHSVFLPAMAAAGHPVDPSNYREIHNPNSQAEDGQTVADLSNAVLAMHGNGVTHIILLDAGGTLLELFGNASKNQGYYPRLGINSGSGATAIAGQGLASNQQLNGAVGLGWLPTLDLTAAEGAKYPGPNTKHCLAVLKQRSGQTPTSTNAAGLAEGYCDMVFLLTKAMDSTTELTPDGIRAAIDALGESFPSAGIPLYRFSPTQHAPAELGWDLYWDTSCTCAHYRNEHRIP